MTSIETNAVKETANGVSRRALLTGGLAGGFLLAFHLPLRAAVNEPMQPPDVTDGKFVPNAFIRIDAEGVTTLVMPQVEMGQGIYTSIAMILAEELDADWSQVKLQHAPPTRSFTAIRSSSFRPPAARPRSGRSGSRCAKPAPVRVPCWCRLRPRNGRSSRELHDVEGRGDAQGQWPHAFLWRVGAGRGR